MTHPVQRQFNDHTAIMVGMRGFKPDAKRRCKHTNEPPVAFDIRIRSSPPYHPHITRLSPTYASRP